jgi:hypothetical protein
MYKREGAVAGAAAKSAQFSIKKFWRRESTGEDTTGMDDEDGLDWSAIDQIVASQSQEPQVNTPPPPVQTANDDAEDDEDAIDAAIAAAEAMAATAAKLQSTAVEDGELDDAALDAAVAATEAARKPPASEEDEDDAMEKALAAAEATAFAVPQEVPAIGRAPAQQGVWKVVGTGETVEVEDGGDDEDIAVERLATPTGSAAPMDEASGVRVLSWKELKAMQQAESSDDDDDAGAPAPAPPTSLTVDAPPVSSVARVASAETDSPLESAVSLPSPSTESGEAVAEAAAEAEPEAPVEDDGAEEGHAGTETMEVDGAEGADAEVTPAPQPPAGFATEANEAADDEAVHDEAADDKAATAEAGQPGTFDEAEETAEMDEGAADATMSEAAHEPSVEASVEASTEQETTTMQVEPSAEAAEQEASEAAAQPTGYRAEPDAAPAQDEAEATEEVMEEATTAEAPEATSGPASVGMLPSRTPPPVAVSDLTAAGSPWEGWQRKQSKKPGKHFERWYLSNTKPGIKESIWEDKAIKQLQTMRMEAAAGAGRTPASMPPPRTLQYDTDPKQQEAVLVGPASPTLNKVKEWRPAPWAEGGREFRPEASEEAEAVTEEVEQPARAAAAVESHSEAEEDSPSKKAPSKMAHTAAADTADEDAVDKSAAQVEEGAATKPSKKPRVQKRRRDEPVLTASHLAEAVGTLLDMLDREAVNVDVPTGKTTFGAVLDALTNSLGMDVRPQRTLVKELVLNEYRRRHY